MEKRFTIIVFALLAITVTNMLNAQWVQTNGIDGGEVNCLASSPDGYVFAGSEGSGVFVSTDDGQNWTQTSLANAAVRTLCIWKSGNVWAGTTTGIYHSTNYGNTWQNVWNPEDTIAIAVLVSPTEIDYEKVTVNELNILSMVVSSTGAVFMRAYHPTSGPIWYSLFRSTDDGLTWTQIIPYSLDGIAASIGGLSVSKRQDLIYVSAGHTFLISSDEGNSWVVRSLEPNNEYGGAIVVDSLNNIYLLNYGGNGNSAVSSDTGTTWSTVWSPGYFISGTVDNENNLIMSENVGLYIYYPPENGDFSNNIGDPAAFREPNTILGMCISSSGDLLVATQSGIYRSHPQLTSTWTHTFYTYSSVVPSMAGLRNAWVYSIATDQSGNPFAATRVGTFESTDGGLTWIKMLDNGPAYSIDVDTAGRIYVGSSSGLQFSTDHGTTWNSGIGDDQILCIIHDGSDHIYAEGQFYGVYRSTDYGQTWQNVSSGQLNYMAQGLSVDSLGDVYAGTYFGMLKSTDKGDTWSNIVSGRFYSVLTNSKGSFLFAGTDSGLVRSTDRGNSWTRTSLIVSPVTSLVVDQNGQIFAGALGSGVYTSVDTGISWSSLSGTLPDLNVLSLAIANDSVGHLYVGTEGGANPTSTIPTIQGSEIGKNMTQVSENKDVNARSHELKKLTSTTFIPGGAGIYKGDLNAFNAILPVELVSLIACFTNSQVSLSWRTETEVHNYGFDVERRIMTDTSAQWNKIAFVPGSGTSNSPHKYSYIDQGVSSGKYGYRLKQINNDGTFTYYGNAEVDILPQNYSLSQNYPNPFNPSTTIRYVLPQKSNVKIQIFNTIGQQVVTLVKGEMNAGFQQAQWNAGNVASGIYFYRLIATPEEGGGKPFVETKKMQLLR